MTVTERPDLEVSDFRTAWAAELARLELTVEQAQRLLSVNADVGPVDPWIPPADLGPMPEDLLPRAVAVLQRQLDLTAGILLAVERNRRLARATAQFELADRDVPVFVDRHY